MASNPCSGRTLAVGSLSNLVSPTAANNTASASRQTRYVSSGNGSPTSSIACAPHIASSYSTSCPNLQAMASITATPCFIISGPIPSPGKTAIFNFIISLFYCIYSYRICIHSHCKQYPALPLFWYWLLINNIGYSHKQHSLISKSPNRWHMHLHQLPSSSIMLSIFIVALMAASVWSASSPRVRKIFSPLRHVMTVCTRASVRPPGGMVTA